MPKCKIVDINDKIVTFKVVNTIYHADLYDYQNVKFYKNNLKRENTIVPEYWIVQVSDGELTLYSLKLALEAYEIGLKESQKSNFAYDVFISVIDKIVNNCDTLEKFTKLFYIEFFPYSNIRSSILQLLNNRDVLTSNIASAKMLLSRFKKRAKDKNDNELLDAIDRVFLEFDLSDDPFDFAQSLKSIIDVQSTELDYVQHIKKCRDNG